VETEILSWLKMKGYFAFKIENGGVYNAKSGGHFFNHRTRLAGVGDLYVLYNGNSIWLEVKSEIGKQSNHQEEFEKMVKKNGGYYSLVRSIAETEAFL
jgi:hypothetical protein